MNPFEIEKKIRELTRRVCCAISQVAPLSQACIDEGSTPHTSVAFGDSAGELELTFSGGSGSSLVTEFRVFVNGTEVAQDQIAAPITQFVVTGEPPIGDDTEAFVLFRATCQELEDGNGNWTVGYILTPDGGGE